MRRIETYGARFATWRVLAVPVGGTDLVIPDWWPASMGVMGATVHQEGSTEKLRLRGVADASRVYCDNAAVSDVGGGKVEFPITAHPFRVGDSIVIEGSTNYDATYIVLASASDVNHVRVTATYAAETFPASTVTARGKGFGILTSDGFSYDVTVQATAGQTLCTLVAPSGTVNVSIFAWLNY